MDVRQIEKLAHSLASNAPASALGDKFVATGLTFDDVLIEPRYSTVVPTEVEVGTRLTHAIGMNIPILS